MGSSFVIQRCTVALEGSKIEVFKNAKNAEICGTKIKVQKYRKDTMLVFEI